jgi:mannose-6-phosphate isomerase-like protein (cupin superfamily)
MWFRMAGMKILGRRDVWVGVVVLGVGCAGLRLAVGQSHASEFPAGKSGQADGTKTVPANDKPGAVAGAGAGVGAAVEGGGTLGAARVIPFEGMTVRTMANGGESRDIAHGTLATGETVNLHQSMQVVGATPSALHVIQHSEFILVREGELEFDHEVDGKTVAEKVGAGGVIYVAYGTRHSLKNVGTVPAKYFVVAIGGDAK